MSCLDGFRTEVDFSPRPDLPPLRMTVIGGRVTPGLRCVGTAERVRAEDYDEAFAAWCHAAAGMLAARHAAASAERTVGRMRPRLEAWYGAHFAERKLSSLRDQAETAVKASLTPLIEREMLVRYGARIDAALAASVEEEYDDRGVA
jgi:hypothetical protein